MFRCCNAASRAGASTNFPIPARQGFSSAASEVRSARPEQWPVKEGLGSYEYFGKFRKLISRNGYIVGPEKNFDPVAGPHAETVFNALFQAGEKIGRRIKPYRGKHIH